MSGSTQQAKATSRGVVSFRPDGGLQAFMGIADDTPDSAQSASLQRLQERSPECGDFGVADVDTEDLPPTAVIPVAFTTARNTISPRASSRTWI